MASLEELRTEMLRHRDWYHKIDLGQGLVTPGRDYDDIWNVCRRTMEGIDFAGKRVLDVGACDGLWSFEAERRGASVVVAADLFDYALERFLFCKRVLGSRVIPLYSVSVYELADSLGRHLHDPARPFAPYAAKFDIVIFFGVLYHLRDPLLGLAQVRSVVREGGFVLLETGYTHAHSGSVMLFGGGDEKRLYPDVGNWWAPTPQCLCEMCASTLLAAREGSITTLRQNETMGRIGLQLEAVPPATVSPALAYELGFHYPNPLPKLGQ
jgi:tRNA (mo5U34)-methyltransferase